MEGRGGWELSGSAPLSAALRLLLVAAVVLQAVVAAAALTPQNSMPAAASPWLTLSGDPPAIIAKGGFSGLFPDSSPYAYKFSYLAGSPDTISWCDVRLTKDGIGVCLPDLNMDNCTNIRSVHPNETKTYIVNGEPISGWFPIDYDFKGISQLTLQQGTFSRTNRFDANLFPILSVENLVAEVKPAPIWLNIQHDIFYREHNLSMRTYLLSLSKRFVIGHISSPEVGFLNSIVGRFRKSKTKLIFRFLEEDTIEPSTNMTYGSLLKNLTFVKTFASGIMVPKHYIWPVASNGYLQPYTSVVVDAHKEGLEVFASYFANDAIAPLMSYNYSYDPLVEVLSFVDNGAFSVDGVLTDFPMTAAEAIECYSHINKSNSGHGKPLVISHNGASGVYPDCTDLSYQQAVKDGADYIDCPVQVTSDGTLICMSSINLMEVTTASTSPFSSLTSVIPELVAGPGIFSFNLTWEDIQKNLQPAISNPDIEYRLYRNPLYKKAGNFMTLAEFLKFAKDKDLSGILIDAENAAFMAEKLGYSITDGVIKALQDSGYSNQTAQEVLIQSKNSSVLLKFKQQTKYKLVYKIDESIKDMDESSIMDIKQFSHTVSISKQSVYPESQQFLTGETNLVQKLQSAGFTVFVYLFRNEFVSQAWDFLSDPSVEINMYAQAAGVDGIITDYPATAAAYRRNSCSKLGDQAPAFMSPVPVAGLLQVMDPSAMPPALAPLPALLADDVVEPPLPPASLKPATGGSAVPPAVHSSHGQRCAASVFASLAVLCGSLLL